MGKINKLRLNKIVKDFVDAIIKEVSADEQPAIKEKSEDIMRIEPTNKMKIGKQSFAYDGTDFKKGKPKNANPDNE
jgi:hypothetical protein